jgi:hypothetical protein
VEAEGETLAEAVKAWRAKAGGGYPDEWYDSEKDVDGSIIAGCEGCERPILEGERYGWGDDGCYTCPDCWEPAPTGGET